MTLRTDVCLSTPAAPVFLSGSDVAAPLISRLSLLVLPRYSVSCRLVEYSWRRGLFRKFIQENNEGNLSLDSGSAGRAPRKWNLAVVRYVTMRIAKTATTMTAIYKAGHCQ